ncbi:OsmC family protein [Capnocytophaga catalasegens]|uniref:Osmotically inducible protein OsmC n=1 Tax=Capnocytophaga catalasegens TaxID=1004260 RepID=A0AAV5AW40_9FLAO|nr:OsmC family protein [Capnocytophaga catalasegens]GIZ15675.1 hypothetical protein RCZ03_16750 [Capnocytophaga catalasegens]GJM49570.1 hypothetical protein RCZ15_05450 [Capnocytophaga catalasegens]GJM51721.1 hypothetical protein RCZ16_00390 [Capnocytophaga catalasegens]
MAKVKATLENTNYYTEVIAGQNTLITDEPTELGGEGKGFSPLEILATSLASCTAVTLKMYADRKEWDLGKIEINVSVENDKIAQKAIFNRQIGFSNTLDNKQQDRLLKVAESCPIHKLLHGEIEVKTELL